MKTILKECERQGWKYDVKKEYASGSKQVPDVLRNLFKMI